MTEFFHVLVTLRGDGESLLLADLSRTDLQRRFLNPYVRGDKFTVVGRIVDPHDLTGVRIIKTGVPQKAAMEQLLQESIAATDRLNAASDRTGAFFLGPFCSYDEDIGQAGEDVTSTFVVGAPGSGRGFAHYLNHPWTLTLLGGLIVAGIAAIVFG